MQSRTARRAGAGYWDFLTSWRRGEQKRASGEAPESGGAAPWRTNPDIGYPVLLVVVGILFFSDPLFCSKTFYFRDILNFHYPLHKVMIDSYARGQFPLWNPYVHLGQPMLANPNYIAFYPTNLFHLFLPFNYAFKLHFIVHPILGGLGLYFLQRRLGIAALAAFGGSLAYQFSGTVLSFLNLYSIVPAVALVPWIGWAFQGALKGNWWLRSLGFGALLSLQIIAFEPFLFQCCVGLLGALVVLHLLRSAGKLKAARESLRIAVVGGIFASALAAVQIFPTIELLGRSARGPGYDFSSGSFASMHPADLLNTLVPGLFGNIYVINSPYYWGELFHEARESYLVSFFLGAPAVLLSLLSIGSARKKLKAVLAVLLLSSVLLALGKFTPVFGWLYESFYPFRFGRYPSKYFLLATLALAILTSLGLEVALQTERGGRFPHRKVVVVGVIGLVLALAFLGTSIYWQSRPQQHERWLVTRIHPALLANKDLPAIRFQLVRSFRASGVFLFLSGALILVPQRWRPSALQGPLLVVLLFASLLPENLRLQPLISEDAIDFVPECNSYMRQNGPKEPFRVAPSTLFHPNLPLQLKIPSRSVASMASLTIFYRQSGQAMSSIIDGIQCSLDRSLDQLNTLESEDLWRACVQSPEEVGLTILQKVNSPFFLALEEMRDPRLRLLSSFETDSNRKVHVYWLENALPRAYFASEVERASSPGDALQRFLGPGFAFGNTVILEKSEISEKPGDVGAGRARVLEYQNCRVLCEVEGSVAGHLVLLDSYYPGWRARLDGQDVEILRANYAFRAVSVPAGKHRVEFVYRPGSFYAGLCVTASALLFGFVSTRWKSGVSS